MYFYIDPALITIGPLSIRYYGLVYAISFLILYIFLLKRRHLIGFSEEECSEFLLTVGLSMIFFGRLFHFVIDNPQLLIQNPLEFIAIWHGGIAFFGSIFGIAVGTFGYLKWKKKPIRKTFFQIADITVLIGSGALIFGRLANFVNQELVGTATTIPWCFNFFVGFSTVGNPVYDTVCRHPYQLYAALSHVLLFAILFYLTKQKNKTKENKQQHGVIFAWFGIIYGITRFIVDFWREDVRVLLGLTAWQIIAVILVIISIWALWKVNQIDWHEYSQQKKKQLKEK